MRPSCNQPKIILKYSKANDPTGDSVAVTAKPEDLSSLSRWKDNLCHLYTYTVACVWAQTYRKAGGQDGRMDGKMDVMGRWMDDGLMMDRWIIN